MRTRGAGPPLLAAGLALGPLVGLGLARFAYGLLLPPMRADLHWSFAQAGTMNTVNAVGYLLGAAVTGAVVRRWGTRSAFLAGMAVTTLALAGEGLTAGFVLQLLLRLAAGVGAAFTFISGAGLAAGLARDGSRSGTLISIYTAGAGAGILLSGALVQPLLGATGASGWRPAWLVLAGLAAVATLLAVPVVRHTGRTGGSDHREGAGRIGQLRLSAAGYFLFGAGYIAYVTFVVAALREGGASSGTVTVFWVLLGVAVLAGIPLWGLLLDRMRSGHCLALITGVLAVGAALPLLVPGAGGGFASAVVFGSAFMSAPAGMAHLARTRLAREAWTSTIAQLTVVFAVGQCLGPVLAGVLADRSGGAELGLLLAAGVLAVGTAAYLASGAGRLA